MNDAKTDISYRLHHLANTVEDQHTGEKIERGANEIDRLRAEVEALRNLVQREVAVHRETTHAHYNDCECGRLRGELAVLADVRDSWCEAYTKARDEHDALRAELVEAEAKYTTRYDDGYAAGWDAGERDGTAKLRAEVEALREALKCERETGVCVMVHDPEREPCNADNCAYVRAALARTGEKP